MDWMDEEKNIKVSLPKVGSPVRFVLERDGKAVQKQGTIRIIDWAGGGIYWGECASCDILVAEEDMLYKHIPLEQVELLEET